jgi:uncharacterized protein YycO
MINLRFATEHGFSSFAIRWGTWSDYSHVDFILPDGTLLGSRIDGGVQIRPATYGHFIKTESFGINVRPDKAAAILDWAHSQVGKPYDITAIIGYTIRRDWTKPDRWFCSELVAAAFLLHDWPIIRTSHLNRVSPQDLLFSPFFRPFAPAC